MDSLHLIYFRPRNPSWIWIRYIQYASHRHNFMSPQNWLCRPERNPALDTLAPISPLVHINGDNAYSPQLPDTQKYTVTLNTSLTRPTTRCHLNIPLSYRVSKTNKPKHHESCSTKNKSYPKLQIKNFRCCVLLKNSFVIHLLP